MLHGVRKAAAVPLWCAAAASGLGGDALQAQTDTVRFATFNASLYRNALGQLARDLSAHGDPQARAVAEIIQRTRPDVLVVNEFDYDVDGVAAHRFQERYLSISHHGADPIDYPHRFAAAVNTGVSSGFDLDNDGSVRGPGDALGFGAFPGQYGMVVFSRYPIDRDAIRTFRRFRWRDMPGALLPDDPATPAPADWHTRAELEAVLLSSKSHWDVPIRVGDRVIHLLVSHPTPPAFDGPEDRNGRRNHDEIRFWVDYVDPEQSDYIVDDQGGRGGLTSGADFVIAGDLNADPLDGDSYPGAIAQLLEHPLVGRPATPRSAGAVEQARLQAGANATHRGDPAFDTADINDDGPGNLRLDYVLPSRGLQAVGSGVFWPTSDDPLFPLVGVFPFPGSDHRLVWVDLEVQAGGSRQ